jgi:hypothetical protein
MGGASQQQPAQAPNIFQQASDAYTSGVGGLQYAQSIHPYEVRAANQAITAPNNDVFQAGVAELTSPQQGEFETQQALTALGATPWQTGAASQGYMQSAGTPAVQRTMNQYLNPYQNQVIDDLVTRMRERRSNDLNMIRGQAAQAGAYGGARQGLVEAETLDRYAQAENEAITQALQQGFDRAAQLGQGQQQIEQAAASGLAGIGAQQVARLAQRGQLGLGASGQDLAAAQALTNAGVQMTDQQLAAARVLAGLGSNAANRGISAGGALVGAAQTGQNLGMNALQQQAAAGAQQQLLNQQLLEQASGQYDAYINYPQTALSTAMAGVYGNPLQNAGTTTGTQSTTPGLFDWLGLGAGLGSSYLRGPMGGK